MKQCNNVDEAFHYDCAVCDEDCKFRKDKPSFADALIVYLIFLASILFLLYSVL